MKTSVACVAILFLAHAQASACRHEGEIDATSTASPHPTAPPNAAAVTEQYQQRAERLATIKAQREARRQAEVEKAQTVDPPLPLAEPKRNREPIRPKARDLPPTKPAPCSRGPSKMPWPSAPRPADQP